MCKLAARLKSEGSVQMAAYYSQLMDATQKAEMSDRGIRIEIKEGLNKNADSIGNTLLNV